MLSSCSRLRAMLGIALLAAEAGIVGLSLLTPRGTQMYQDFYILHSRDCWLPAEAQARVFQALAREVSFAGLDREQGCFVFAHGWRPLPGLGPAALPRAAWADLPMPGARALEVTLVNGSRQKPQLLSLSVNGRRVSWLVLPPGPAPVVVRLQATAWRRPYTRLRLDWPHQPAANPVAILRVARLR